MNAYFPVLTLQQIIFLSLITLSLSVKGSTGSSLLTPLTFNPAFRSNNTQHSPLIKTTNNNNIMPSKTKNDSSTPSALQELKETIQKQAKEIEQLKSQLQSAKQQTSSTTTHGHGPPATDEDPNLYKMIPFYKLAFRRVGWLFIFLMSLSFTAIIMNGFEHTLSKQIELAYFVPLLAGHGGNTGGQTVGSVLSALSTKSITTKDAFHVIHKEAMSGLTVGVILGSFIGLIAYHVGGISIHVSTVVFCTLPLLSTIAATLASSIPFICTAVGLDPAIIAAPAMTTFVDVSGLLSYFLIANKIFSLFGIEL